MERTRGQPTLAALEVQRLFMAGTSVGLTDAQLLDRYVRGRDSDALETLAARHSRTVLAVCRPMLRDPNDVEDAVQATLLVFVRKAASLRVRPGGSLSPWFHGVAYRVASRVRRQSARRGSSDLGTLASPETPPTDDLASAVHDALNRLPGRFREPIVLCYFEGLTHNAVAERLGLPLGTVRSRLARGRDRLRDRLQSRGIDGPAGLLVLDSAPAPAAAGWSPTSAVSTATLNLVEGVLSTMLTTTQLKLAAAVLLCGLFAGGATVVAYQIPGPAVTRLANEVHAPEARTIESRLDDPLTIRAGSLSLVNALMRLGRETGLEILIDSEAVERKHVDLLAPVQLDSNGRKVRDVLKWILGRSGLVFEVRGGHITVTTPDDAVTTINRLYSVGDLLAIGRPTGKVDLNPLVELITSEIAPGSWRLHNPDGSEVTSPKTTPGEEPIGSITPFYLSLSLHIRTTPEVHGQVENLLRKFRKLPIVKQAGASHSSVPEAPPSPQPLAPTPRQGPALPTVPGPERAERVRLLLDSLNREFDRLLMETGGASAVSHP